MIEHMLKIVGSKDGHHGLEYWYLLTRVFKNFGVPLGRGTVETRKQIFTLSTLEEEANLGLMKVEQSSGEPGVMLELQDENALLKDENTALKKQLEDLTQQMLRDQNATNERIDKNPLQIVIYLLYLGFYFPFPLQPPRIACL
ncbi:hypothetical protein HAX54_020051 [Datura stramonium]|uniref:Uncharacterized protein n=1 Tax=Datura stramonium TaxID=4076 RepID=A0ABS8UQ91_DATST|nr:hypothetical protein [Datura stramonium]